METDVPIGPWFDRDESGSPPKGSPRTEREALHVRPGEYRSPKAAASCPIVHDAVDHEPKTWHERGRRIPQPEGRGIMPHRSRCGGCDCPQRDPAVVRSRRVERPAEGSPRAEWEALNVRSGEYRSLKAAATCPIVHDAVDHEPNAPHGVILGRRGRMQPVGTQRNGEGAVRGAGG